MRLLPLILLIFLSAPLLAQNVGGSWYGKAQAKSGGNNYLTELIIKQKGDELTGILGYYFKNGYKSIFVRGYYNQANRQMMIYNIPITYFKAASIDGMDCLMDFRGTVLTSKVNSTLKGSFISDNYYKYTCPELQANFTLDYRETNQDSLIKNAVTRKLWQPAPEDIIVSNTDQPNDSWDPTFQRRENVIADEIEVESDSLRISFYDNGDIDGDSISVFLNNRPILIHKGLKAEALDVYIKLDSSRAVNEITMYAENLGEFPPNTALMVVNDGINRKEVYLSSNLYRNASVKIRKRK